jgi:hypothetical protein
VPAPNAASASGGFLNGAAAAQQDEAKPKQDEEKPAKQEAKPPKSGKQEMPARQQKADKDQNKDRDQARHEQGEDKRQSGQHGRIRDEDFKTHFGQTHKFSVRTVVTTTRVVPHETRFAYSGYSFVFVDPWPAEWALTDDCYIDYIDGGYYIVNLAHPGMRVAVMIAE